MSLKCTVAAKWILTFKPHLQMNEFYYIKQNIKPSGIRFKIKIT